jgi:hypothetical protein
MGDGIGDFAFGLSIGAIGLGLLIGPVGRAIASWIESKIGPGRRDPSPELQVRLSDPEAMAHRVQELEERLDFTERVLASGKSPTGEGADTPPEPAATPR